MTLKQCIDITLQKHYNSTCYKILGLYFALPELLNQLDDATKEIIRKEGCVKNAFCRGPAREFIKSMSKADVVDIMRKE